MDDISICHLGDLGHPLTEDQTEELGNVDILMLPVGGISTINAATAASVVRLIEPKIVLPMHYGTGYPARTLTPSVLKTTIIYYRLFITIISIAASSTTIRKAINPNE